MVGQNDKSDGLTRRGVLGAGLAGAAALGLGTWGSAGALADTTTPRQPGTLPYPNLAPGTDTIPQIKHIVVLMMENHSYDNRLGTLRRPGADGFSFAKGVPTATNPYANGDIQHAFRMPTTCQLNGKPSQEWTQSHIQLNGGNNGFVISDSGPVAMGYWDTADQPFYHSLARTFPIADKYFSSVLGQTYPNRRYLIGATSIGQIDDTAPALTDYPKHGTIFDALNRAGVSWKDYYSSTLELDGMKLPAATALLYPAAFFKNPGKTVPVTEFFSDAAAGTLPGYCIVEPDYGVRSEENPQNIAAGEAFAASVVNAVMSGPGWSQTLLIWTYDEHGGYYDHVTPPAALAPDDIPPAVRPGQSAYTGFTQYGFRVPFAIVSPYARPAYVSHQIMDHTSICALVEYKWNLRAMTLRDANALPPLDMLDFSRAAFAMPPALAEPLVDVDPSALACNVSGPGTIPPPGSVTAG